MNTKKWFPNIVMLLLAVLLLAPQQAWAAPTSSVSSMSDAAFSSSNSTISYQGYLVDADGNPINDASLAMVFKLYNVASGGAALWEESQNVAVSNGLFSVELGATTAIPTDKLADNNDLWLGITIGSDTEMAPREKIASAPYALLANVPDGSITEAKLAQGAVASGNIKNDTIDESNIADSFVARNADKLDGNDASAFALSGHLHDGRYYTESESNGRFLLAGGKATDADKLDGHDTGYFATSTHNHNSSYINVSGDTMTGDLTLNNKLLVKDRIASPANTDLVIDAGFPTSNKIIMLDTVTIRGDLELRSDDTSRGDGGRALAHLNNNTLIINYDRDFTGGVIANNFRTGAIVEENLMTPAQSQDFSLLPFEQGDVLCWDGSAEQLAHCASVASPLVVAVADDQGKPIVLGAEPVKVTGVVQPGDLLVSSDEPSYAAAWSQVGDSSAPIGLVIAKALESSDGGHKVIKAMILGR